ncbi:MAG: hypothetical protein AB7D27_14630 [Desulfomicrobium sp.]
MDKDFLKTIIACVTALAISIILAASVKYYTDGTRYSIVTGTPPVAYLVDRREGRAVAYLATNAVKNPVFSLVPLKTIDDFLDDGQKK